MACLLIVYLGIISRQKAILRLVEQNEVSEAFSALFHNSPHGFAVLREDGRVLAWNRPMTGISGYTHTEINQRGLSAPLDADARKQYDAIMAKVAKHECTDETCTNDLEITRKDGKKLKIHAAARLAFADNGKLYILLFVDRLSKVKNVTDIKVPF